MTTSTVPTTEAGPTDQTRRLLRAGIVAGPFFVLAGFAQIPFRAGFDLSKHAFSFLLIGPGGWVQAVVFVAAAVLMALAGVGLRRILSGRTRTVAFGAALGVVIGKIIAGVNAPQPSYGYPIGTAEGPPAVLSNASILHGVGFGLAVTAWIVLLVTLGVVLRRRGPNAHGLAGLCHGRGAAGDPRHLRDVRRGDPALRDRHGGVLHDLSPAPPHRSGLTSGGWVDRCGLCHDPRPRRDDHVGRDPGPLSDSRRLPELDAWAELGATAKVLARRPTWTPLPMSACSPTCAAWSTQAPART